MRRRIYEMIEKGEQEDKISLYYDDVSFRVQKIYYLV